MEFIDHGGARPPIQNAKTAVVWDALAGRMLAISFHKGNSGKGAAISAWALKGSAWERIAALGVAHDLHVLKAVWNPGAQAVEIFAIDTEKAPRMYRLRGETIQTFDVQHPPEFSSISGGGGMTYDPQRKRMLVAVGYKLYSVRDDQIETLLESPRGRLNTIAYDPERRSAVTGGPDGFYRLNAADELEEIPHAEENRSHWGTATLVFHPGLKAVLGPCTSGDCCWLIGDRTEPALKRTPLLFYEASIAYNPNEQNLFLACVENSNGSSFWNWDAPEGEPVLLSPALGTNRGIFLNSAESLLRYEADTQTVFRWSNGRFVLGNLPAALEGDSDLSFAALADTLYAFDREGSLFEYASGERRRISEPTAGPGARSNPGLCAVGTNSLLLFGGEGGPKDQPLSDTWVFNRNKAAWRELDLKKSPPARVNARTLGTSEGAIIWKGEGRGYSEKEDAWFFAAAPEVWCRLPETFAPFGVSMPLFYDYETGAVFGIRKQEELLTFCIWDAERWQAKGSLPKFPAEDYSFDELKPSHSYLGFDPEARALVCQAAVTSGRIVSLPLADWLANAPPFAEQTPKASKKAAIRTAAKSKRKVEGPIQETWQRIDEWLAANMADVGEAFRKGATNGALTELEQGIKSALPNHVRQHFAWHDGDSDLYFIDGRWSLLSVADSLTEFKTNREIAVEQHDDSFWPKTYIPIASDAAGNAVAVDADSGEVVEVNNDPYERKTIAPDLAAWLEKFHRDLESGIYGDP